MSAFSQFTWYVLTNALQNVNNTLTAANNTQAAFNADSPSSIYFSPGSNTSVPFAQQWQIFPVNTTSASAYILRNRQIGASAYLTTAITTRKCGGGTCATVPVLSPSINNESLWSFGDWGFSDAIGGATIYNLGNTSSWRLDTMLSGPDSEMVNTTDTGQGGQHWFFSAHEGFAATDSSMYAAVPATATALLAQFTNTGTVATPSIQTNTAGLSGTATSGSVGGGSGGAAVTGTSSTSSTSSGLSSGAAAGIGVGVAVAVIALFIISFVLFRRRRRQKKANNQTSPTSEMGQTNHHATTLDKTSPRSEASTYVAGKGPLLRAEMQSPSESSRVELYSEQAHGGQRYEMPHPSNSPRVEMEHPSTRNSTIVSSTEGVTGSDDRK